MPSFKSSFRQSQTQLNQMSIRPSERLEHTLALETLAAQLADAQRQLRAAQRRIAALEIQMRREGWTQEDLDEVQPSVHQ